MMDTYCDFVRRVLRRARTPSGEIEDQVQLTFIAAARRLDDVSAGCEKAFLYRIAANNAAHAHRTLKRRSEVSEAEGVERVELLETPEQLTHVKKLRQSIDGILKQMETRARDVFVLQAFEDLDAPEIATLLGIPTGTVASRLRRARAEFRRRASALGYSLARPPTRPRVPPSARTRQRF
jgi:RNA polymerase sigma-70 factor (ECF subfamily)